MKLVYKKQSDIDRVVTADYSKSMSAQKLAFSFLIIASLIGLTFIFVRRFVSISCPQNDVNICQFIQKNRGLMNTKMGGTYTSNQTDDVSLQIEWQKSADVSTIKIDRNENEILDAIIGPRYVYIKDYADNKWWREQKNIVENSLVELPFNPELFFTKLQTMLNNEETAYTYIEDIACGDEQCHRYQVTSANQKEGEQLFVFFSTTDFKLRSIFMVEDTSTGELNVVHKEVSIIEPENIKIVSSGRNIFAEYIELKDKEEQKNFEYLQQFQQQRLESEGTGTIPYVEDEATEEAVFFP